MTKEKLIQKFLASPKGMHKGAPTLARRYNLPIESVYFAKERAKELLCLDAVVNVNNAYAELEDRYVEVHNELGTLKAVLTSKKNIFDAMSDIELADLHRVDLKKYKITNYWTKVQPNGKFTSSLFCKLISEDSVENFTDTFTEFLKTYKGSNSTIAKNPEEINKPECCLVIPKQDSHFNKYDILGENNIHERFSKVQISILDSLNKASLSNSIKDVIYIIGSDQFNSEWTSLTTKGTPQQNILTYQDSFARICTHEVEIINTLVQHSQTVRVVFVPGNHDEFVGWHLINWLESYFRNEESVVFNTSTLNTKYLQYNNVAIMLNHGDAIKPKELAQKFPIGYKEGWSSCDHYYIFTGDKHHELSLDINGIKFYQVPQLSNAKSNWDDKQGYTCSKAEMQVFVISNQNGMTDIYKTILT